MDYQLIKPIHDGYSAIEQVLTNRGIKFEDIDHYLNVSESDNLSPLLLKNIESAAKLIFNQLSKDDFHIHVQVDSDCDGYTSAALLLNYIHAICPSAISHISYSFHAGKIHGINPELVPANTTLVIAPDSSSNDYDIHKALHNKGVEVLVLDHHQAERISEYACIVNNQLCDYPTKSLSGVGVVYKLCQFIDSLLPADQQKADDFLDVVAIGLVGDMMDLRDFEIHYLVQTGLGQLRNPFIKGMAEKNHYQLGDNPTPIGVAFYIVPLINSITRVGTMEEKTLLFESMLDWKAFDLVPSTKRGCAGQQETRLEQSLRTCTNVKNRQTRNQDAAVEQVKDIIEQNHLLDHKILLVKLENPSFDRGITGLIANKLMAEYQRPVALLVKVEEDGKPAWSGSARGYEKSKLNDFRGFCRDSGLVYLAEGHPNAFGFGILDENFDAFLEYADTTLKDIEFSPSYKVDFIHSVNNLSPKEILELGSMKNLWGQNMDEPLIAVENVAVTKDMITLMARDRNPTLKIQLPNGVTCIKFKSSEEELDSLFSENGCVTINLVGKAEVNKYFNSVTPQLIIQNYEIINRQEYYF